MPWDAGHLPHCSRTSPGGSAYKKGQRVGTDFAVYLGVKTRVMGEKGLGDEK